MMNKHHRYLVGTLFDEQEQDKKTNLSNMKAKDPMGNTRWKGAFTGGFQAGYKNTCGSKDGWAPASFVSSVNKKAQTTERNIFDYMDKQDLGRQAVGQNIVLNNNFQSKSDGYNITIQQSIGEQIIQKLKKMEAHQIAPQNQQQLSKLFELYSKEEEQIVPSYFLHDLVQPLSVGSNVSSIPQDDFIEAYQDFYRKVIREHVKEESQDEIKKRREENRIHFDFTRPLQEEPQYLKEIQDVGELQQQPKKRKKNLINQLGLKNIYTQAQPFKQFDILPEIDKAPQDYDPFAKMRNLQPIGQPKKQIQPPQKYHNMTSDKRGQLLGEVKLSSKFISSQNSLSNKFMSNQKKVQEISKFFEDEKKNQRFKDYIEEMEGKKISSQLEYLTYEQAEQQRNQFDIRYKQYLKSKSTSGVKEGTHSHQKQSKDKGSKKEVDFQISRKIQSWRPEKLLCKRFNVLTPYPTQPSKKYQREQAYF